MESGGKELRDEDKFLVNLCMECIDTGQLGTASENTVPNALLIDLQNTIMLLDV